MMTLVHLALSWFGIGVVTVLLLATAIGLLFLPVPRRWTAPVALGLVLLAAGHGWSGWVYQQGRSAAEVQCKAEAEAEQARQAAVSKDQIDQLVADLALAQKDAFDAGQRVETLKAALAARPPIPGRGATQDDVNALNP